MYMNYQFLAHHWYNNNINLKKLVKMGKNFVMNYMYIYTFGVQNIKDIEVSVPHDQEMFGVCVHHQFIPAWSMQINTKTGLQY